MLLFALTDAHGTAYSASEKLKVEVLLPATEVRLGEPIRVGIRITNLSDRAIWIDGRMMTFAHIRIVVRDESRRVFRYPGWNTKIKLLPPNSVSAFLRLQPGVFVGKQHVDVGKIVPPRPGRYEIEVRFAGGPVPSYAKKFRVDLEPKRTVVGKAYVIVK